MLLDDVPVGLRSVMQYTGVLSYKRCRDSVKILGPQYSIQCDCGRYVVYDSEKRTEIFHTSDIEILVGWLEGYQQSVLHTGVELRREREQRPTKTSRACG
jgi:hypothetical protein